MVAWWWLVVAFAVGAVLPILAAALVYVKALREFDRDIERRNAELDRRIASGCRQTLAPPPGN